MDFYAAQESIINPADLETFSKVKAILAALPNLVFDPNERDWDSFKNQISCHLICRALAKHVGGSVYDGYFVTSYQHSWLVPVGGTSIIDAYPVAGAAPFIVANDRASPWSRLYIVSDKLDKNFAEKEFKRRLRITTKAVGVTCKKLGF
jgi:hypothetical protein